MNQKAKSEQCSSKKSTTVYKEAAVLVAVLNCFLKANHSYNAVHYKCKYMTCKKFSLQNNPASSPHPSKTFTASAY